MCKTVEVYTKVKHPRYGKFVRQSARFKAHDEKNEAQTGDKVLIFESRPLSKTKRWMFSKVIERDGLVGHCLERLPQYLSRAILLPTLVL